MIGKKRKVGRIVDCAVHPSMRKPDELRDYMAEPWRSRAMPSAERYFYPAPNGEYRDDAYPPEGPPASDPDLLERHVLTEGGADTAILLPLTRGLSPDLDLGSAICSATNEWLAERWLTDWNHHHRYRGSIRINPDDPKRAIEEIERWSSNRMMVQVAVPLEAHRPYGQRNYHPIWEAAARHHLPVVVHSDGGCGTDFWPTPVGYPRHYAEYNVLYPANAIYHLFSFIAEGVFNYFPELMVVFADGGLDYAIPLMWKLDINWRVDRDQTPWVSRIPSEYLASNVRFCFSALEGPMGAVQAEYVDILGAQDLLLFASDYPRWPSKSSLDSLTTHAEALTDRVLGANAVALYGI